MMRTNTLGVGLLSAMALVVGLGSVSVATADTSPDDRAGVLVRWEGHDRYQVSARVSNQYPVGIARIFVASGEVFTDALSGAPIAARQSAPILLTRSASLPKTVRDAIVRLKPGSIVVLGGPASVSPEVYAELATLTTGSVSRWSGPDRYSASAAMSAATFAAGPNRVFVASGLTFPDALSGAPAAGAQGGPVLLTRPDWLPSTIGAELARLRAKEVVVLGGSATVGTGVEGQLGTYAGAVTRWSGSDRFATSAAISRAAFPNGADAVFISSGRVFPDALSAAPIAGMKKAPLLLLDTNSIPAIIDAELRRLNPTSITVVGGRATVTDEVFGVLSDYLRSAD